MQKRTDEKLVVVTRETRADDLKKRFNTLTQAEFYVESRGGKFADYEQEDQQYKSCLSNIRKTLEQTNRVQFIDRSFLPNYLFGPQDVVIAIGQDGLVANTLKYLHHQQPLIGVNPDPERWDGVLLPFVGSDLESIVPEVINRTHRSVQVSMAEAQLNDGQQLLAVNDFFIGKRSHTSARYWIESQGHRERQSSSGVIVSTGLGSTGWLKSLFQGASKLMNQLTGGQLDVPNAVQALPWDLQKLFFTVREPFPSRSTQAELVFGEISPQAPLTIRSIMPEDGVIFSDGLESDYLEFNSGAEVRIDLAKLQGNLVVR